MKDPLEFLNDVQVDLDEYEEYSLTDIEKQKMKNKVKSSIIEKKRWNGFGKLKKVSGLVAGFSVSLLLLGICFPAYAKDIPVINQVIEFLNINNEIDGYKENSTPVETKIEVEGYDLTIEDFYYDGNELSIFYKVVGEEKLDRDKKYWFNVELEDCLDNGYEYSLENGEFINDNTYAGMMSIYIQRNDGEKLPEVLNGKINIKKLLIGSGDDKSIDVKADSIKFSLDSSNKRIKEYAINKKFVFDGDSVEYIKAKEYPAGIYIELKSDLKKNTINHILWDSKKGCLNMITGFENENMGMEYQYRLPSRDGELYIIPYVHPNISISSDDKSLVNKQKIKMEKSKYDLGSKGTFEILQINDIGEETEMRVRVTGMQANNYISLRSDGDNEYYRPINEKDKNVLGILDMEVTYIFNKFDKEKDYYIETDKGDLMILQDQIIKIEKN